MKKKLLIWAVLLLSIAGILLLLYPDISNLLAERNHSRAIQEYKAGVSGALASSLQEERERAVAYNDSIAYTARNVPFSSLDDKDASAFYFSTLNTKGIMGYISIPKINVSLPIYHGTDDDVLRKGVGHMSNTAMPIGGAGYHSVLTGHSGLPSARLFNDLEQLAIGDVFYLYILDETLAYMVDDIIIIEPTSTDFLAPNPEADYISLVTCTPYGINSHRLIVRGSRIPYVEEEAAEVFLDFAASSTNMRIYIIAVVIVIILIIIVCLNNQHIGGDRKRLWLLIVTIVLFIAGICAFIYPALTQRIYSNEVSRVNADYFVRMSMLETTGGDDKASAITSTATAAGDGEAAVSVIDYFYEQMVLYNERLFEDGQSGLDDSSSYMEADAALAEFGYSEDMIGYIAIPRLDIELPLYLGASKENMKKGAAHMTHTSLPVGGENTNAVIAAHRGLSALPMFREIEKMEIGDEVYIVNFRETLRYQVTGVKIIDPADKEDILIQPGRDMITLLTCHPYRHNYQRYLVYCERLP